MKREEEEETSKGGEEGGEGGGGEGRREWISAGRQSSKIATSGREQLKTYVKEEKEG